MYRFNRTARFKLGKGGEGSQWAANITALFNQKFPGHNGLTFLEQYGEVDVVHWQFDFDDIATATKVLDQLFRDADFQRMVAKVPELFIDDYSRDTLLRSLEG